MAFRIVSPVLFLLPPTPESLVFLFFPRAYSLIRPTTLIFLLVINHLSPHQQTT